MHPLLSPIGDNTQYTYIFDYTITIDATLIKLCSIVYYYKISLSLKFEVKIQYFDDFIKLWNIFCMAAKTSIKISIT